MERAVQNLFMALLLASAGTTPGCATDSHAAKNEHMIDHQIQSILIGIDRSLDKHSRDRRCADLLTLIAAAEPSERDRISAESVDQVALLLRHPDEAVRRDAARALGMIGFSARRALGTLEEASRREFELLPAGSLVGPGSAISAIEFAMDRIRESHAPSRE